MRPDQWVPGLAHLQQPAQRQLFPLTFPANSPHSGQSLKTKPSIPKEFGVSWINKIKVKSHVINSAT